MFEVRTSYLPEEISWAERLCPLLTYERDNGRYEIDFTQFHRTRPVSMPDCSASQWLHTRHLYKTKTKIFNTKHWKTDDDDDDDELDDYSVSFTIQSPDKFTRSSSGLIWNLFKSRYSRDVGVKSSIGHEDQTGSLTWSVKSDFTPDRKHCSLDLECTQL